MELETVRQRIEEINSNVDELEQQVLEVNRIRASIRKNKTMAAKAALDSSNKRQKVSVNARLQARSKRMGDLIKMTGTMVKQLMQHKWSWPFMKPVDVEGLNLHDYFDVIKEPMDLGTIKDKIDGKSATGYGSPREICDDVRLTFRNAMTYNKPGHDVHVMADNLLRKWEERWQQNMEPRIADETLKQAQEDEEDKEELAAMAAQEADEAAAENMAKEINKKLEGCSGSLQDLVQYAADKCRPMTFEEKRRLGQNIGRMPPENVNHIIQILREMSGTELSTSAEELEFDIDAQEPLTLWRLENYIQFVLCKSRASFQKLPGNKRQR